LTDGFIFQGGGPAGLACATTLGKRGINTVLFEKRNEIGGQFNLAKRVPGKEEFFETLRYFKKQLELTGVDVRLNSEVKCEDIKQSDFSHVVLSTGVLPRELPLKGFDHPKVVGYTEVLSGKVSVGNTVAVVGAGGIGFDVSEFLSDPKGELTSSAPVPGIASEEEIKEF